MNVDIVQKPLTKQFNALYCGAVFSLPGVHKFYMKINTAYGGQNCVRLTDGLLMIEHLEKEVIEHTNARLVEN